MNLNLQNVDNVDLARRRLLDIPGHVNSAFNRLDDDLYELELYITRLEDDINILVLLTQRFHDNQEILADINELKENAVMALDHLENNLLMRFVNNQRHVGRPRYEVSKDETIYLFNLYKSWKVVSMVLGISERTLRRRRIEHGLEICNTRGPRSTYTNINNEILNNVIREILDILPDAGETIVIGALRTRGIHVQRARIRQSIMEVDPIGRLSRRSIAIVRRIYNVKHPNELWYICINKFCLKI